ncbi:hypothetical protein F53441_12884 [Fusarium austroafricanum]|uniref:Uncharacterized protein n=1 Tax=Fusarium austroafricanum TaxID=2364996 RepID=A0A8H4NTR0_9HYPO|nr:hypothetical protein F53441_12884 [Fusarium austroafricanum]
METRELVDESVERVVHVVEEVLEIALEEVEDVVEILELDVLEAALKVDVVDRKAELVPVELTADVKPVDDEPVKTLLVKELIAGLVLEPAEVETLVALLLVIERPEEVCELLDVEDEVLAKLTNTLSEVLHVLEVLVDALVEALVEVEPAELLVELVLLEAPLDVELPDVDRLLEVELLALLVETEELEVDVDEGFNAEVLEEVDEVVLLLVGPVLVDVPLEVVLEPLLEVEIPLVETEELGVVDENANSKVLEEVDVEEVLLLVEIVEVEVDAKIATLEEVESEEELLLLMGDNEVGRELL